MNNEKLIKLKKEIELLSEERQLEVLNIINSLNIPVSENNNGCFINLSLINSTGLKKLQNYLVLIKKQEEDLTKAEDIKKDYLNTYFKDNKESKVVIEDA